MMGRLALTFCLLMLAVSISAQGDSGGVYGADGLYGPSVMLRETVMKETRRAVILKDNPLPKGGLVKGFKVYIHPDSARYDSILYFQIWEVESVDERGKPTVTLKYQYTFNIEAGFSGIYDVPVELGSEGGSYYMTSATATSYLGFTEYDDTSHVSMTEIDYGAVYMVQYREGERPLVGGAYQVEDPDSAYLFSLRVQIDTGLQKTASPTWTSSTPPTPPTLNPLTTRIPSTTWPTSTPRPTTTPFPTSTPLRTPTPYRTSTPWPTTTSFYTSTPRPTTTTFPTSTPWRTPTPYRTSTPWPTTTSFYTSTPWPTTTSFYTSTPFPTSTPWPKPTTWPTSTPRPTTTPFPTSTTWRTPTPYRTSTPWPTTTSFYTSTPFPTSTPWPKPTTWPTSSSSSTYWTTTSSSSYPWFETTTTKTARPSWSTSYATPTIAPPNCAEYWYSTTGQIPRTGCKLGTYGDDGCERICSRTCAGCACDRTSGVCLLGCTTGFYGPFCESWCDSYLKDQCDGLCQGSNCIEVDDGGAGIIKASGMFMVMIVLFGVAMTV